MKRIHLVVMCSMQLLLTSFVFGAGSEANSAKAAPVRSRSVTMSVTSYAYTDNYPPSALIAYPKNAGYHTHHNLATEGKGTYADPITMASYRGELPVGSIVYVPFLRKYFIMEDACGQCQQDWSYSGRWHIDLWVGPHVMSSRQALLACEYKVTRPSTRVVLHPAGNLKVDQTPLFKNNRCTARFH